MQMEIKTSIFPLSNFLEALKKKLKLKNILYSSIVKYLTTKIDFYFVLFVNPF